MGMGVLELRDIKEESAELVAHLPTWRRYEKTVGALKKRRKWHDKIEDGKRRIAEIDQKLKGSWA
jgi:hypothetical protein